jgi:hypothetical protein
VESVNLTNLVLAKPYIFFTNFAGASDKQAARKREDGRMKTHSILACSVLVAIFSGVAAIQAENQPATWVEQAVSADAVVAKKAQDQLRQLGPHGLELLEQRFAKEIAAHRGGASSDTSWKRIALALDRVGGQYDNYASGLYWYTDLEEARKAARASGRPILSLRLLGRLDEDLSCANSRFFRTTLYPSAEVNELLKNGFILHWESVRPAPRVTIDFGDGRKLERTITGNSIHYILDADGKIVDALPGLYSAKVFTAELNHAAGAVKHARATGAPDYKAYQKATEARLLQAWAHDIHTINDYEVLPSDQELSGSVVEQHMNDDKWQQVAQLHWNELGFDPTVSELMGRKFPDARAAAPIAVSKMAVEGPLLQAVDRTPGTYHAEPLPTAQRALPVAAAKAMVETPMMRAFANLSETVLLDTVKNNYMRRTKILAFLAESRSTSLSQINDWVYASIFLTPREDPWLGLAPPDVYTAIDNNGESDLRVLSAKW